ncbi:MAG: cytochrome P450 [Deinococcales bacterium]
MMDFSNTSMLSQMMPLNLLAHSPYRYFLLARREVDEVIYQLIDKGEGESLLQHLRPAQLRPKILRDQLIGLVSAGFDTSAAAFTWALYHLLEYPAYGNPFLRPEAQQELRVSLKDLELGYFLMPYFKESMRLYPPARRACARLKRGCFSRLSFAQGAALAFSIYFDQHWSTSPRTIPPGPIAQSYNSGSFSW